MIEKEYKLSRTNEKAIEKVIFDENLHYLHMNQRPSERFWQFRRALHHYLNSNQLCYNY